MQDKIGIVEEYRKWLKLSVNELTAINYVAQVNKFLRADASFLDKYDKESLQKYLIDGQNTRSYDRLYALKKFIIFLCERDKIDFESTFGSVFSRKKFSYRVHDRREIQTLTYNEILKLIENVKNKDVSLVLKICADTGARVRSILKLKTKDIGLNERQVFLHEKGGKNMQLKITPETCDEISAYVEAHSKRTYLFFDNEKLNTKILNAKYSYLWSQLKNESKTILGKGLGVSFHWARRGVGVYWYKKTKRDIVAVQHLYGHKSTDITQRYLMAMGGRIQEEMDKEKRPWGKKVKS